MELPQPRSYGTEGRKPTHDFLSLYNHSTHAQQDPRPSSKGVFLKTHDFLQPLERPGTMSAKEEIPAEVSSAEKPPPPAPPPSVEHVLPGGIGTYTISHVSHFNPRVPKPEAAICSAAAQTSSNERNDENSNCSSYTAASGFILWEETAAKTGKTEKENSGDVPVGRESVTRAGQWTSSLERASQSSTSNHRNHSSTMPSSGKRNRSFVDMIKSAQYSAHDEDLDDEEDFLLKKEVSTITQNTGELRVEVDRRSASDQKANTPRSKHSATEQRRRCKINDRFQMLREIIPHSDQKRDKASFLLEVIEYIQFLQEKVHTYEGSYPGWNHETPKLMQWKEDERPVESFSDQAQGIKSGSAPILAYSAKIGEKNMNAVPGSPVTAQNRVEPDISTSTTFKAIYHHTRTTDNALPFHLSSLQPSIITPIQGSVLPTQLPNIVMSNAELSSSHPQPVPCPSAPCTTDVEKLKDQDLTVEGGTISISSVYSQGLLNTLTQALQSSGVDLSKASISVQIELGKRSNNRTVAPPTSTVKDCEIPCPNQEMMRNSRPAVSREDSEKPQKRMKTSRS